MLLFILIACAFPLVFAVTILVLVAVVCVFTDWVQCRFVPIDELLRDIPATRRVQARRAR